MNAPTVVLVAAVATVAVLARPPASPPRTDVGPLLPRPAFLKALFAGELNLVADYYWIQTTHQIGAAMSAAEMRDVYAYADLATSIDPHFMPVYWFAGVALPVATGRDQYANVDESIAILRKGAAVEPGNFKIKYQLAQNLMHFKKDYRAAAEILKELSTFPEAPSWLPALATRLYAEGGSIQTALELAVQQANSAEDEESRAFYLQRVKEIQQEIILRHVDEAAVRFKQQAGRAPANLEELLGAGLLPGLPPDPLGGSFFLDEKSGRAMSSSSKHRFELIQAPSTPEELRGRGD